MNDRWGTELPTLFPFFCAWLLLLFSILLCFYWVFIVFLPNSTSEPYPSCLIISHEDQVHKFAKASHRASKISPNLAKTCQNRIKRNIKNCQNRIKKK